MLEATTETSALRENAVTVSGTSPGKRKFEYVPSRETRKELLEHNVLLCKLLNYFNKYCI